MYPSAEEWLDKIGKGRDEIQIAVSTKSFAGSEVLSRYKLEGLIRGTLYVAKSYKNVETSHEILLCPVTLYVFGKYPKVLYYRVL